MDEELLVRIEAAFGGDPDAAENAFSEDAVLVDHTSGDRADGIDAIVELLGELAGRRGVMEVEDVLADEDLAAVRYALYFRADAHQYAQRGTAWVTFDRGLVASWEATWYESTEDLSAWDGD